MEADTYLLPKEIRKILGQLGKSKYLAIKGGVARLTFLKKLISDGKIENPIRIAVQFTEEKVNDLDVVIIHYKSLAESKEWLLEKEAEIRKKLSDLSLPFGGEDLEPVRGKSNTDGHPSDKVIEKILNSRDLTINEVLLVPNAEKWYLYYTAECWRDTLSGVGMVNVKPKHFRYDSGRIILANYGLFRLLKFWVDRKVEEVFLPQWMVNAHLKETKRLQEEKRVPTGANLGWYSLIVINKYKDKPDRQERWMMVLNKLGLSNCRTFEEFAKEQNQLFRDKAGFDFEFESGESFGEVIDRLLNQRKKRAEMQNQRKENKKECNHQFQKVSCSGCTFNCQMKNCTICTKTITPIPTYNLACNKIMTTSDWKTWTHHNPNSLRDFL